MIPLITQILLSTQLKK